MIFRVEVSNTIYVVADSERDARNVTLRAIKEESEGWDTFVAEETVLDDVESKWRNAIPYGSKDDKTVTDHIRGTPVTGPENMEMDI